MYRELAREPPTKTSRNRELDGQQSSAFARPPPPPPAADVICGQPLLGVLIGKKDCVKESAKLSLAKIAISHPRTGEYQLMTTATLFFQTSNNLVAGLWFQKRDLVYFDYWEDFKIHNPQFILKLF